MTTRNARSKRESLRQVVPVMSPGNQRRVRVSMTSEVMDTLCRLPQGAVEGPYFDRAGAGHRVGRRDLDRLGHRLAVEDVESADRLLRLDERSLGDHRAPVPYPDGRCPAGRGKHVAVEALPAGLHVVEPREA